VSGESGELQSASLRREARLLPLDLPYNKALGVGARKSVGMRMKASKLKMRQQQQQPLTGGLLLPAAAAAAAAGCRSVG
jgi:hypothetical protein